MVDSIGPFSELLSDRGTKLRLGSASLIIVVAFANLMTSPFTAQASDRLVSLASQPGSSQLRRAVASESVEKISSTSDRVNGSSSFPSGHPSGESIEVILVDSPIPTSNEDEESSTRVSTESVVDSQPLNPGDRVQVSEAPGVPRAPASQPEPRSAAADTTEDQVPQNKAPSKAHHTARGPGADKVLSWLKNGNKRFLNQSQRRDGRSPEDRKKLAAGQHPHAIVLSCSDSRVPPELVFDQALGELFVVRSAGASIDDATLASLEYAVEHLGPTLLIVMGHTSCGAVRAAIETPEGQTAGSPHLDRLITHIRSGLPTRSPASQKPSKDLSTEGRAHTHHVAADLIKRSSILKSRVEKGDLKIVPALYDLHSGVVQFD